MTDRSLETDFNLSFGITSISIKHSIENYVKITTPYKLSIFFNLQLIENTIKLVKDF